mgnify:CR=1 FL=1
MRETQHKHMRERHDTTTGAQNMNNSGRAEVQNDG